MAANVLKRCFDLDKVAAIRSDIIAITEKGFREWLSKRSPSQKKSLASDLETPLNLEEEIVRFKLMVKRDAKVKLDASCLVKHPPAQTIMFHRKAINAIYSQCFDEFKNRVLSCLSPNIIFFTEMTNQKFADIASNLLGFENVFNIGEIDFSKYDKSQDAFIKSFDEALYEEFGFDPELLSVWMEGEYRSEANTMDGQVGFTVDCQRKSGASNTWIGNSVVTLGILAMYYDVSKFQALFVSGDDSLIFSADEIANYAEDICLELGFETKFLTPSVPYFCSKFLVFTGDKCVFVPDPYKLLVKLGASREEVSDEELFEVFVSFRDLTKEFGDERVLNTLSELVHLKYEFESGNTKLALSTIHCLRSNFLSFSKLFVKRTGWKVAYGKAKYILKKFLGYNIEPITTTFGDAWFVYKE